jgi:hypothetical protein
LGLTPWYTFLMRDDRVRDIAIINHNYLVAFAAMLTGIGAGMILFFDLTR